jgi:hypothetical protein
MIASQPSKARRSARVRVQSKRSKLKRAFSMKGATFDIEPYERSSTPTTS